MPPARIPSPRHATNESRPTAYRVDVANETDAAIDAARLAAAVQMVLGEADCASAVVSVAIVDDPTIHRLNRQFLEHDYATDVLSFALAEPPDVEGEIIASIDTARREAAEAGWSVEDELLLYAVHGALHLVGYLDKDPADAAAMRAAERRTLARLGVTASPGDPRWHADSATPDSATPEAADLGTEAPRS
jgi:probable rRNA maturation factor